MLIPFILVLNNQEKKRLLLKHIQQGILIKVSVCKWLGVGEEEDNSILQNSDFYPHYDVIMGQNRVKTGFFTVEGTFLDGFGPNLVCELVGGGRR